MDFKILFSFITNWLMIMVSSGRRYTCDLLSSDGNLLSAYARASLLECASRCRSRPLCHKFQVCPVTTKDGCRSYDVVAETNCGFARNNVACGFFKQMESMAAPPGGATAKTTTLTSAAAATTTPPTTNGQSTTEDPTCERMPALCQMNK